MRLILENYEGKVARTFDVDGESAVVVDRKDTRRLEIHRDTRALEEMDIRFDLLGEIDVQSLRVESFAIGHAGRLRLVDEVDEIISDVRTEPESRRSWHVILGSSILLILAFVTVLVVRPIETAKLDQELKQQVVQIVKRIPPKPRKPVAQINPSQAETPKQARNIKPTKKTATIKRMGALSVLGSLKSGKQRGGLNLGAVNTTAGPGLGGTAGSGGVQTTLYGKGLVAAPLGAGSNMQGGGGYGTKGKGGGKAGYGKLSLIGSAGSAPIPLGREAIIEGGLDRDLIADVISKNMGQIRFCYEQGLQGDPALAGRVAVNFVIGGGGTVKLAGVESTTLNSKLVEDCMVMRLRSWKFPLPEGGVDVKVSYPFVLRRAGGGQG